jgi:glycosyltransferase involved in cell wall biosynthesis
VSDGPAVTLMVITYNHERYVDDCLRSVAGQTFADLEVLIVDDASTDATVEHIRTWLARIPFDVRLLVNEQNLGICATRNRAIAAARGTFLSSLSGDDFYEPDKVERQHRALASCDDSVAVVFSNMRVVREDGVAVGSWFPDGRPPADGRIFDRLVEGNFIPAPTAMSRRAAVVGVGGYDEDLFYEDYDMWLRLADRHEFRFVPGELVNYRWSASSVSRDSKHAIEMHDSRARILMKWQGRDPRTDTVVRRRAWSNARRVFMSDAPRGRALLRTVARTPPPLAQRAFLAMTAVPGSARALRAAVGVRDQWRRIRRRRRHPRP